MNKLSGILIRVRSQRLSVVLPLPPLPPCAIHPSYPCHRCGSVVSLVIGNQTADDADFPALHGQALHAHKKAYTTSGVSPGHYSPGHANRPITKRYNNLNRKGIAQRTPGIQRGGCPERH